VASKLANKREIIRNSSFSKNKYNSKLPKKKLVIAWAPFSARSEKIAHSLNSKLFMKGYRSKAKIFSLLKYLKLSINTLNLLKQEKPNVVICQLPPLFLAYSILFYKLLTFSKKPDIVLDLHTASFCKPWTYFGFLNNYLYKKSLQLIVTNKQLLSEIDPKHHNKVLILEDAIFDVGDRQFKNTNDKSSIKLSVIEDNNGAVDDRLKVGIICSFAPDEPISEIITTAKLVPDVKFFVSGDHNRINKNLSYINPLPSNLLFTGFLDYPNYRKLISSMDVLMVLTTRNKTLLSGCYEAVMVEKPLITSNFEVLQDAFNKGTVFVDNSVEQMVNAIGKVQNNYWKLKEEIKYLKEEKTREWNKKIRVLESII
jgi:hypothetical protein